VKLWLILHFLIQIRISTIFVKFCSLHYFYLRRISLFPAKLLLDKSIFRVTFITSFCKLSSLNFIIWEYLKDVVWSFFKEEKDTWCVEKRFSFHIILNSKNPFFPKNNYFLPNNIFVLSMSFSHNKNRWMQLDIEYFNFI